MKKALIIALLTMFGIAHALDIPKNSEFDNRIQYINYNPDDIVAVRAVIGRGTRVVFSPNEVILDIASGFTQGWELVDTRNILYIKAKSIKGIQGQPAMSPEPGKWDTNLMVTTNLRIYDMDLFLLPDTNNRSKKLANKNISYRIEYKYPDDELAAKKTLDDKNLVQSNLDAKPEPSNWSYSMQIGDASENIAPTMVYDDGRFTYLKFPNNRDFPSARLVGEDKNESLIDSHIDPDMPDTLVLHRVSREMSLRLGNAVVSIFNDNFDPDGTPANQGTTVPGVKRVIKSPENN